MGWISKNLVKTLVCGVLVWGQTAWAEEPFWTEADPKASPVLPNGYSPLPSLSGIIRQLQPSVVNIFTTQVIRPRRIMRDPMSDWYGRAPDPYDRFFGGSRPVLKQRSLGSGFIVSSDGYIVTNHHVVARASEIRVKLSDERSFDAKLVGSDPKTDLALLKIEAKGRLPVVTLGDSDRIQVGDWVVAIGNPFGLSHTVTAGIISAKEREIGHGSYDSFLQTDASINPGNSGGPLFDSAGRVVGINSAIVAHASGIGFAVPINLAKQLLPQLHKAGRVRRGWLGVGIQDLTELLAERFGVKPGEGVLLSQVFPGSPADKAGLRPGDVVMSVNGKKVEDSRDLSRRVALVGPGHKVRLRVLRDGKRKRFYIKLEERDAEQQAANASKASGPKNSEALGLRLAPLSPERARRLGLDGDVRGLAVLGIDPLGPTAGILRQGDVILEIDRHRVTTVDSLNKALKAGSGDSVLMLVQRGRSQVYVVITAK